MNTTEHTAPDPQEMVKPLNTTSASIRRNGFWFTLPPLFFSLGLMTILPNALTAAEFNEGIPRPLLIGENVLRILTFAIPLFFLISFSSSRQRWGLKLYLLGLGLYFLSYGTQNFFPQSVWSLSFIGFIGSAFLNVFWMIGLGLMGEKFIFIRNIIFRPIHYLVPALIFLVLHSVHATLYYQINH